jgi:hypothetical protein
MLPVKDQVCACKHTAVAINRKNSPRHAVVFVFLIVHPLEASSRKLVADSFESGMGVA